MDLFGRKNSSSVSSTSNVDSKSVEPVVNTNKENSNEEVAVENDERSENIKSIKEDFTPKYSFQSHQAPEVSGSSVINKLSKVKEEKEKCGDDPENPCAHEEGKSLWDIITNRYHKAAGIKK